MAQNAFFSVSGFFCDFVKKSRENVAIIFFQLIKDGDGKKIEIAILRRRIK